MRKNKHQCKRIDGIPFFSIIYPKKFNKFYEGSDKFDKNYAKPRADG